MIYFLSEQRIKTDFLNDNMDSDLILNAIRESQDIYLRTIIGDSLYNTLSRLIENDIVVEPYKNLLDNFIIIYLEYKTLSSLCVTSTFKLSNMGMAQAYDSNINTQSMQNVKYLQSHYDSKASFYESRLTEYLTQNINVFPDYKNYKDITTSRSTTSQSGLFLGGARTITTINDIDMKHDNTVRSYVRYDIYQNLSERQKEIARENIGVTANGEINVDLENYYTKDEVFNKTEIDVKLIPYITTNEVNLRLNSYYDKNTVNNLLDNLPIPESTSELVKDDVYTKTEVDERIANVSSGGTVDLSNYYTKQEVDELIDDIDVDLSNYYNKEQVDTLIENSGGSDTSSNIVDIMSLAYDEQLELIDFVIDNNRFPDLNTLYTYRGYVLNNLTIYSDWWDEPLNQRYVVFNLYAHPKSYDIRFITFDNGFGEIYNDFYEKGETENLVKKGELFGLSYNNLNDKPIVDLLSLSYNEQVSQIDIYSDINVFVGGYIMTIEGIILNGNKCVYEIIGNSDDAMPIKQVDFYINRTKDSFIIRFITRYNEAKENIPYEFIYTNENGDTLDTLNLVTKSELEETIGNINNILNTI